MRTVMTALACALLWGAAPAAQPASHALTDPSVLRFTEYVEARMQPPLSDAVVVSGIDLLLSAIEGVAIAQGVGDEILDRAHALRREARQLYPGDATAERTKRRQKLFEQAAVLVADLNTKLPPASQMAKARVEALDRSARGLERESPLPKQPDSIERFFRHAAEALRVAQP